METSIQPSIEYSDTDQLALSTREDSSGQPGAGVEAETLQGVPGVALHITWSARSQRLRPCLHTLA